MMMHKSVPLALIILSLIAVKTCLADSSKDEQVEKGSAEDYRSQVIARENPNSSYAFESLADTPVIRAERWSDFLPIWGQEAKEQGYILPLPFGLSLGYMHLDQPLEVTELGLEIGETKIDLSDAISARDVEADDTNITLRADVWLFPFLNVYGILGKTDGRAKGVVDLPSVCVPSEPIIPANQCILINTPAFALPFDLNYEGNTYGAGVTVAGGIGDFFGMIDYNETTTNLDISNSDTEAKITSARVGWNGQFHQWAGSVWIGAMHQDIAQTLELIVPNSQLVVLLGQQSKQPLNYLVGGRWNITEEFEILIDVGFGSRKSQMINLSYRL